MVDSVLMFTTLGSNCFAICENAFDICCGEGTVSGLHRLLPFFPLHTVGNHRSNQNPQGKRGQNTQRVSQRLAFKSTQKALSRGSIVFTSSENLRDR